MLLTSSFHPFSCNPYFAVSSFCHYFLFPLGFTCVHYNIWSIWNHEKYKLWPVLTICHLAQSWVEYASQVSMLSLVELEIDFFLLWSLPFCLVTVSQKIFLKILGSGRSVHNLDNSALQPALSQHPRNCKVSKWLSIFSELDRCG